MKRLLAVISIVAVACALVWIGRRDGSPDAPASTAAKQREAPTQPSLDPTLKEDLSGAYLRGYGEEGADAARDLVLVKDVLDAFLYTVKIPDALPTSGNREIMAALQGDNPYRIRFLKPSFDFLNADGELEDRWGTPLYFHFVEAADVGIRSAGPDRRMWTADDVVGGEYAGEAR